VLPQFSQRKSDKPRDNQGLSLDNITHVCHNKITLEERKVERMDKEDFAVWVTIIAGLLSIISDAANITRKLLQWFRRRK